MVFNILAAVLAVFGVIAILQGALIWGLILIVIAIVLAGTGNRSRF